jgi:hypothetical protein
MKSRFPRTILALALGAGALAATAVTTDALACGNYMSDGQRAQMTVRAHFTAINAHDTAGVLAFWENGAVIVSDGLYGASVRSVERAAKGWTASTSPITYTIDATEQRGDVHVVKVSYVLGAMLHHEELYVARTPAHVFRILGARAGMLEYATFG